MKATKEQLHCVETAKTNKIVVISACAGSGKTSTLVLMSKSMIQSSLYLAFNKISATEAESKFPQHVECRTTHSIAYAKFGVLLRNKLTRPKGTYVNVAGTGSEIARYYKIVPIFADGTIKVSQSHIGILVKTTITKFEQSADNEINEKHLPIGELKDIKEKHKIDVKKLGNELLKIAKKMWADRIDPNSVVAATHDTYLKLYQLSKPKLNVDIIYLDEAQDTTECVLDIVLNQTESKLILVGDKRQNIYGWRGSINAMEMVKNSVHCDLSKSFRYGQKIADVASSVLDNSMKIVGNETIDSIASNRIVDRTKPYTMLCRTNAYLMDTAIVDIEARKNVSIEVDVRDFIKVLESTQALFDNDMKNVKHERVVPFNAWAELVEESANGGEFRRISQIVENNKSARMISILSSYVNPTNPDIIYTTSHKSKGREFSQVILGADYPSNYDQHGDWIGLATPEQNLLYVACTRAINVLEYNNTVLEIINKEQADSRDITNILKNEIKIVNDLCDYKQDSY